MKLWDLVRERWRKDVANIDYTTWRRIDLEPVWQSHRIESLMRPGSLVSSIWFSWQYARLTYARFQYANNRFFFRFVDFRKLAIPFHVKLFQKSWRIGTRQRETYSIRSYCNNHNLRSASKDTQKARPESKNKNKMKQTKSNRCSSMHTKQAVNRKTRSWEGKLLFSSQFFWCEKTKYGKFVLG